MKNKNIITITLLLLACMLIFTQCNMGPPEAEGYTTFGFVNPLLRSVPAPTDISAVLLTVIDANTGDVVLDNHKMALYRFNSTYVSDSINLMQGDYTLTQFLVVDDSDSTIYAAPLEGSSKAGMVSDPLPMNFSVTADTTTNVQAEVVGLLTGETPQDYGYSEFSFTIIQDPKAWDSIEGIDNETGFALYPRTALDDYGRSITVWREQNGSITNLWASRYTPQAGWSYPVLLDEINIANVGNHMVTTDKDGNAIIVWSQHDGSTYHLWAKRYVQGSGWQPIEDIATHDLSSISIKLSTDNSGNATLAWNTSGNIYVKEYDKDTGWDTNITTLFDLNVTAHYMDLATNNKGKSIVSWTNGGSFYYSTYEPATGWDEYSIMFNHSSYYGFHNVSITLDDFDNLTIAYAFSPSTSQTYVYGRRYTRQAGVTSAYAIDNNTYSSGHITNVSSDNQGNAVVTWIDRANNIMAVYYDLEFGWQSETELFTGSSDTRSPRVEMDEYGNAVAMWTGTSETTTNTGIFYNTYDYINGWAITTLLEATPETGSFYMDMNFAGEIAAVWENADTGSDRYIQASFYK